MIYQSGKPLGPELRRAATQQPSPVYKDDYLRLEVDTPTVGIGSNGDFLGKFEDQLRNQVDFITLKIDQVEIDSPNLADTDTVTLLLYRSRTRQTPRQVVARYSGVSQLSGMWKATFTDENILYFDQDGESTLYGRITNASGNSASATFHIVIMAHRVR